MELDKTGNDSPFRDVLELGIIPSEPLREIVLKREILNLQTFDKRRTFRKSLNLNGALHQRWRANSALNKGTLSPETSSPPMVESGLSTE